MEEGAAMSGNAANLLNERCSGRRSAAGRTSAPGLTGEAGLRKREICNTGDLAAADKHRRGHAPQRRMSSKVVKRRSTGG
jgi:hypothetical protein